MNYFIMQLDVEKTTLRDYYPEEQHEAFLTFMHRLDEGKAFPDDYRIPCNFELGSNRKTPADADLLMSTPAFSPRAQAAINAVAAKDVQFIGFDYAPATNPDYPFPVEPGYAWLNVLNRVSCLEYIYGDIRPRKPEWSMQEKKHIPREPAPILKELRFHPEKVEGLHIFRPAEASSALFITEQLKDRLESAQLLGLQYKGLAEWLVRKRWVKNDNNGFWPGEC